MNTQEATIAALQNRVNYLEAHLHLALQVLDEIEKDAQDLDEDYNLQEQHQVIDIVPTSKVALPKFLNSRTWKHPQDEMNKVCESSDRLFANAS